jgi:hypothetical protein
MNRAQFSQHIPALRAECELLAIAVAWGNMLLSDAVQDVLDLAKDLGSSDMPPGDQRDLQRFIERTINRFADLHAPAVQAHQTILNRTFTANETWMAEWQRLHP